MKSSLFYGKSGLGIAVIALACVACGKNGVDSPSLPAETNGDITFEITPPYRVV